MGGGAALVRPADALHPYALTEPKVMPRPHATEHTPLHRHTHTHPHTHICIKHWVVLRARDDNLFKLPIGFHIAETFFSTFLYRCPTVATRRTRRHRTPLR